MNKIIPKVTVIGAGAVGATLAQRILESGIADVVLLDVAKNMAIAKSFDLLDASSVIGHERSIFATDDYKFIAGSAVVVITAGLARKPGMSRDDLVKKNAAIVSEISSNVKKMCPGSIVIVVTNPLDVMTYLAAKAAGFERNRVFGMAGLLDTSRFVYLVASELKVSRSSVKACIMGSHGDTMVPILSKTLVDGKPITEVLAKDKLDSIIKRTRDRGAEIVSLLGTGSAYYSPSAAAFRMVEAVLKNSRETFVVSACLKGEYGLSDIAIGVPCVIGASGINKIMEIELTEDERNAFRKSAAAIKETIGAL